MLIFHPIPRRVLGFDESERWVRDVIPGGPHTGPVADVASKSTHQFMARQTARSFHRTNGEVGPMMQPSPHLLFVALLASSATLPVIATAQRELLTFHDVASLPWTDLRPGLRIKVVVGEFGTFAFVEMEPGVRTSGHHHTHEQVNLGLSGSAEVSIDGSIHRLDSFGATITPANATHLLANNGNAKAVSLEFQPVRRLDLVPPRSALTFPASPQPVPLPRDARVFALLAPSSSGQDQGTIVKELAGKTGRLRVGRVGGAQGGQLDLSRSAGESFVYVVEGKAEVTAGANQRKVAPQTLVVVSGQARDTRLNTAIGNTVMVVIYDVANP
jgi:quercetin dioxygenase-like cupin family protein